MENIKEPNTINGIKREWGKPTLVCLSVKITKAGLGTTADDDMDFES